MGATCAVTGSLVHDSAHTHARASDWVHDGDEE